MHYTISAPLSLQATLKLPASKSISNRVLIINKLAQSGIDVENLSDCDDTFVMERALKKTSEITDIMAAGTAMRFLTAYFSVSKDTTILTGTDRMLHRPILILAEALQKLGADIHYIKEEGYPPLRISGRTLNGGKISLAGNVSSQFTSALLLVGPMLKEGLQIELTGKIISKPYIDMTLRLMKEFGAEAYWMDSQTLHVSSGGYKPRPYKVENDWSASSYWYEMVALSPDKDAHITLPGLFADSAQGDSRIQEFFEPLGVSTQIVDGQAELRKSPIKCSSVELNLGEQPDLAQTLVVCCALQGLPFKFTGLESLRIKETDRLKALKTELSKLGIHIKISNNDTLSWNGKMSEPDSNIAIDTYEDHRMAMAFAPACFKFEGLRINNPQVVSKSYPKFWNDLKSVGFTINSES